MAKVILDIPTQQIQPFLQMIVKLGIANHSIQSNINMKKTNFKLIKKISSHLLFDWEFFSNELEFE